jgi:hypothetical protein
MRVRAALWLSLALCSSLAAQQTVVVAARTKAAPFPATFSLASSPNAASVVEGALPAELDLSEATLGLAPGPPVYGVPPAPAAVCMQSLPRVVGAPETTYAFDHLQLNAAAIKGAFSHDNLVKMARNFKPGQPLPDAPSYVPLTKQQKFDLFLRQSHSFDTVSGAMFDSLIAQATGAYPTFGGGIGGYGKRLAASMAGAESAAFFGSFVFPAMLHQDPRYFRSQDTGISNRLAYAASRVIIGRSDSGHAVINTSLILSEFVQAAVSNAYIPYRNESVSGTIENAVFSLGSVAQARILDEFWPDIKAFVSHHEPAPVHRWQDKWNNGPLGQWSRQ